MGSSSKGSSIIGRVGAFARRHIVLTIAVIVVIITMIIIPPDGAYLDYVEWDTLGSLFCVLAVANALRLSGAFDHVARWVVTRFSTPRLIVMVLVLATGIFATVATNDLTLIVMLPFTATTLIKSGWERYCAPVFLLECLAANLCGMILPFGNPHNLYLYSYYGISVGDFLAVLAVPFIVSMVLIVGCTLFIMRKAKGEPARSDSSLPPLNRRLLAVSLCMLAVTVLAVLRVIPVFIAVIIVGIVMLATDWHIIKAVDYPLLLTFICFFIFAGNMARMPFLNEWLGGFMAADGLLTSVLLSQVISNVPTSVLLSHFTGAWAALVVGTNIGGTGTLVGSLANLITFRNFTNLAHLFPDHRDDVALKARSYLKPYLILNFGFLVVLFAVARLCGI